MALKIAAFKNEVKERENFHKIVESHPYDLYPTPTWLADEMISYMGVQDGDDMFDPGAGTGALLDAAAKKGANCFFCEINQDLIQSLVQRGYEGGRSDFLTLKSLPFKYVAMNPPFSENQAVQHFLHCWNISENGTNITCLLPSGSLKQKRNEEALKIVENYSITVPKTIAGAFKYIGTGISVDLIYVRKT